MVLLHPRLLDVSTNLFGRTTEMSHMCKRKLNSLVFVHHARLLREGSPHNGCSCCLLGKQLPCCSTGRKGSYPRLAPALQALPDVAIPFLSRGGNVPFSTLVSNFCLGARAPDLRVLQGNSRFNFESSISSFCDVKAILRAV